MKRLYLDCDGVLLNTIETAFLIMKQTGLDINDYNSVHQFFVDVDWYMLIEKAGILNDSIDKVKYLQSLKMFYISILTTCVNVNEPKIKTEYFGDMLPGVRVITVPWQVRKDTVVKASNNILVDDSRNNIINWREVGGIGLQFDPTNDRRQDLVINDLLDIPEVLSNKRHIKKI